MTKKIFNIIGKSMAGAGAILVILGAMAADLNPLTVVMRLLISGLAFFVVGAVTMQLTGSKVFYVD